MTLPETALFLLPQAFLAYTLMYVVVPRLVLKAKYTMAVVASLLLLVITGLFSALLSVTVVDQVRYVLLRSISPLVAQTPHTPVVISIGIAMLAGLRGAVTVGGVAAAVKLMKSYYEQQHASFTLEREKVKAELQMLKAQLHPHFLFNTLNNIFAITQEVSPKASGMVARLSSILRYILYECNQEFVPLDKEIQLVCDYLELEKHRYDESLEMCVQLPPVTSNRIAPLLLLPFVENVFKHGTSHMTEHPWMSMDLTVINNTLVMKLVNGTSTLQPPGTPGIGIANVRKRLQLLYPQRHVLEISEEEGIFMVNLKIDL